MSSGQQQYTIFAPASTSSGHISPPDNTLPPSISNKRSMKQTSSTSTHHTQRSTQPPGMTASVAQVAVDRLISAQLKDQGFDGAGPVALHKLGDEVIAYVENLYRTAHDYANLANRSIPTVNDLRLAFVDVGLEPADLRPIIRKRKRRSYKHQPRFDLIPPPGESPVPEMLLLDDDESSVPATIQELPPTYPPLPPRHTYVQTPPSPPKKQALPSLEKKLKNAGLVQESLRNLLVQTEDVVDPADTDLLGAIVNCESTAHPRKKWKVSKSKVEV
ncbi:unnamed protein product [Peniophora sp. CBMAI 1063]|nr:unnamed protein product [Peniophora sp. CBMAI 1063]